MQPSPSIAIIGGGPSGLVFARLLEQAGITDYVIFERDTSETPGPDQQGGTLDLRESSGQLALKRAGLFEEFSKRFARWDASSMHIIEPKGTTVARFSADADSGHSRPEIDRLQLRQLLLRSVPGHKIRWGHAVSSVVHNRGGSSVEGNGCLIHFTNGASATGFRLVVGADGTWSKVRPLLTPAKPVYSGKIFVAGHLSQDNPIYAAATDLAGPGSILALGGHKTLVVQQVSEGSYRMYFGLVVPEDFFHRQPQQGRTEALRKLLLTSDNFYANWAPQLKAFINHAEGPFRSWVLYRMNPDEIGWERSAAPGVTLLGDAAHATTPFLGEGANCSMHDATVLADCIVEHCGANPSLSCDDSALERALTAYEKNMFPRGRDLIVRSTESEIRTFADDSAAQLLEFFANAD